MGKSLSTWWLFDVMPIYYAHASWIKFCLVLFVVLEVLNFGVAYGFRLYVKNKGPIYNKIVRINQKYQFHKVARQYSIPLEFSNLNQMRNFNPRAYAERELKRRSSNLYSYVVSAKVNRALYKQYMNELSNIDAEYVASRWGKLASFLFLKYEKDMYHKLQKKPMMDPTYYFKLHYSSPAGRNSYRSSCTVEQSYFERVYDDLQPKSFYGQQSANTDESPIGISAGLRYDVMQRDRFRCTVCGERSRYDLELEVMPIRVGYPLNMNNLHTICFTCFSEEQRKEAAKLKKTILKRDNYTCRRCGHSQAQGYKLHVDHIRPIKKWGLSTEDNLWTLCASCNLGKGTKYDPREDYLH